MFVYLCGVCVCVWRWRVGGGGGGSQHNKLFAPFKDGSVTELYGAIVELKGTSSMGDTEVVGYGTLVDVRLCMYACFIR